MNRFEGKTVFITGAASGFGALAATRFSSEGANCVVVDLNDDGARNIASNLPNATAITLDVVDAEAVADAFEQTVGRYGRVDVIFNNAGIDDKPQALHETDDLNWQRVSRVNGDGAFNVLRAGIAAMLTNPDGGSIVNTVSIAALIGVKGITPYTYAKAGITGLTRSSAAEYAEHRIRINAVAPGSCVTPLLESFIAAQHDPVKFRKTLESNSPLPGFATADSVVGTVMFLASQDAASITGLTIPVDNGQTVV
ncbi:SDR family NAD(P)-dependent oxidoreductase [Nocardia sp. 348MFTsu5.1]|uniref:SDR family NAD(P)-dependent oxidoreductase n=1 Tax=Nocardia sp. 348MFTsu5.1 TaxID=1172185 RepID=UPI00036ECF3A|nr:SDR family NAD(P)-dependent oxidoreductase [Nocardia sp. 348MFTsu5.1]